MLSLVPFLPVTDDPQLRRTPGPGLGAHSMAGRLFSVTCGDSHVKKNLAAPFPALPGRSVPRHTDPFPKKRPAVPARFRREAFPHARMSPGLFFLQLHEGRPPAAFIGISQAEGVHCGHSAEHGVDRSP